MNPVDSKFVLSTCPRDCYDACGLRIRVEDEKIIQVAGDPDHHIAKGKLCKKCSIGYNSNWLDADARLTTPLRRTGVKGIGQFEAISWETAIREICERLHGIVEASGGQSIYSTHYTGTFASIGYNFPIRFFNRIGATEVNPDSVCNLAGHIALDYVYGTSLDGFDPRTVKDSECIIVWGANPATAGPHVFEHWLKKADASIVVIDPICTDTASVADIHLQPFPGSDAALAFSLMNVIVEEGLIDEKFINDNCVGWDELKPSIERCTPHWGEQVTGVPSTDIISVARMYANGPSLLWLGQGFQRQPRGGNAMRACAMLPALTGNLGKPGCGFLYLNGSGRWGMDDDYLAASNLLDGKQNSISHMDFAAHMEDAEKSKAVFCWNVNNVASSPEQSRLRSALSRNDLLTVAIDIFPTDTTDYADYVLPAATFLESNDLIFPYFDLTVSTQVKAAEPLGDSLPNSEIFRKLAKGMGYTDPELYESDLDIIDTLLTQLDVGETFESLKQKGTVQISPETVVQFANLNFSTPSGKIEMASGKASNYGLPRVPDPHADARPKADTLRLLSPATPWAMNTTFGNSEIIDKHQGAANIVLHPRDASDRGLVDGEAVRVFNATGSIDLKLKISSETQPGVALSYKGRWIKRNGKSSNINILNPGEKADMGGSCAVHGIEVKIDKAVF